MEPLANKVRLDEKKSRWYRQYNRRTHGYDEQLTGQSFDTHMNNRQFETLYIWTTGGRTKYEVYNKLLEQQTNSANPIPAG